MQFLLAPVRAQERRYQLPPRCVTHRCGKLTIYSTLCDDAKLALLDAERRHQDQGTIDWNAVTESFGKAIEFQVKQRFLPELAEFFASRQIFCFPDGDRLNGDVIWPIIKSGKTVDRSTLGTISIALSLKKPELAEFSQKSGIDLVAIGKWIAEVNGCRKKGAHAIGMSFVEVSKLRERWLGIGNHDGGIFGVLFVKG